MCLLFNQHLYLNSLNKYQIVDMFLRWSFLQISSLSNRARLWTGRPCHVNLWILDYRRSDRTRIFSPCSLSFTALDLSSAFISIKFNSLFFFYWFVCVPFFVFIHFKNVFFFHFSHSFFVISNSFVYLSVLFRTFLVDFPIEVFVSQI